MRENGKVLSRGEKLLLAGSQAYIGAIVSTGVVKLSRRMKPAVSLESFLLSIKAVTENYSAISNLFFPRKSHAILATRKFVANPFLVHCPCVPFCKINQYLISARIMFDTELLKFVLRSNRENFIQI